MSYRGDSPDIGSKHNKYSNKDDIETYISKKNAKSDKRDSNAQAKYSKENYSRSLLNQSQNKRPPINASRPGQRPQNKNQEQNSVASFFVSLIFILVLVSMIFFFIAGN